MQKLKAFFGGMRAFIKGAANRLKQRIVPQRGDPDEELFVERKNPRPFVLSVLFTVIKGLMLIFIFALCAGMGLLFGISKAYVDTSPDLDIAQLTKSDRTSYIYDMNGEIITTFSGMEYRDWADVDDIPDMLKNALISIEDVRFYKHGGVDYKRLFSAVINTLRNADTHGGSTITQQLIKNKILSSELSYKRKIQEAYLAVEVEHEISKNKILEAYMNDVYLGGSNYGMKAASKDYFGKELSALTIRECAMLAGMVQKPQYYNPRLNTYSRFNEDGTNKMSITDGRTDLVIKRMYEAGYITKEQCDNALRDTVTVVEHSARANIYDMPYFVEYAIRDVIVHLIAQRGLLDTTANRNLIENELRTGGYHIYLTVDPEIQRTVQNTLASWKDYPKLKDRSASTTTETLSDGTTITVDQPQAAAVVFDYHTGELRAIVGGRESPVMRKLLNRAYQSSTPVGSSIKPLSVYGPALDLGLSPASPILNFPSRIEGWDTPTGYPYIGDDEYIGPITMRRGIVSSLNVAAARTLMDQVSIKVATEYLINLGIDPSRISSTGSGLSLGTTAITPIEMAAAFGAIAAGGEYREPLSFSRVVDESGKVILDAQKIRLKRQVYKPSTAYMLIDVLTEAVNSGTGTNARMSGMTVAGKTGTNADYSSAYFVGMTPYYTASVWVGHDKYIHKLVSGSTGGRVAAPIWKSFMQKIHSGLPNKPIFDVSPTEIGLVRRTVCAVSGLLATEACQYDAMGYTPVTDWFYKDSVPTTTCDMHVLVNICSTSNQIATIYCPPSEVVLRSVVLIRSNSPYSKIDMQLIAQYLPHAIYSDVPVNEFGTYSDPYASTCQIHSYAYNNQLNTAITQANQLILQVQAYLGNVQNLPDTDRATLEDGIETLREYIGLSLYDEIVQTTELLRYNYGIISEKYPPIGG